MINYESLVVTEYMRYVDNFGAVSIQQLEQPIQSLVDMNMSNNSAIIEQINGLAQTVQSLQQAVNKPRIKRPVRDSNGVIIEVIEE